MDRRLIIAIAAVVVVGIIVILLARPRSDDDATAAQDPAVVAATQTESPAPLTDAPTVIPSEPADEEPAELAAEQPAPAPDTSSPTAVAPAGVPVTGFETPPELQDESAPGITGEFTTDFSVHSVSYKDVLTGGPPKDGIPAIDDPNFISISEADEWLSPTEPVVLVKIGDDARAYPLQVLTWHEIVNDTVDGQPVVVTFCPLCNTAIAFNREFDGQVLDFGTTGRLRFSNLIMYDRQTETWWQQASGDAIAGHYTGSQLEFLPAAIVSWADFKTANPDGLVLSRETGFRRDYGRNPYAGYDDINSSPFLFRGPDNTDRLPAMERVLTIELNGDGVAYPYSTLTEVGVVNDEIGGELVAVFWESGTASALDASALAQGRDVGTANSFSRELDGQVLTFSLQDGRIVDDQTGTVWDVLGQGREGELAGSQLEPVVGVNHFWFSWAAFKPETRIWRSS
ncbi:MAG: DUF3179 domain-containing (seleno)protein [Anaerolineales bacterium]|nr:DUF3179 domain-containing (seleno)protein [Anaerolineales bacterium]